MAKLQKLTLGEGIGIGVIVGFVAAVLLGGIAFFIVRADPFSSFSMALKNSLGFHRPLPPPPKPEVIYGGSIRAVEWETVPNPNGGEPKWKPNPPIRSRKNLPHRMVTMTGGTCIRDACFFEFSIHQMVYQCIIGHHGDGNQMPEVPSSIFNDDELNRLAGDPANGGTWSESLSNIKTRPGAVRCFIAQVLFKHMDPLCNVDEGFVPTEIAALYQLLNRVVGPFKPEPTKSERICWLSRRNAENLMLTETQTTILLRYGKKRYTFCYAGSMKSRTTISWSLRQTTPGRRGLGPSCMK